MRDTVGPDRQWQTICLFVEARVNINVKQRIRYNGQEYSDPTQLPPEVRAAYEKAMNGNAGSTSDNVVKRKFVVNGQELASENEMPKDVRRLCEDVMSVVENNGEVTLPGSRMTDPLITKRQLGTVFAIVGALVALACIALATR